MFLTSYLEIFIIVIVSIFDRAYFIFCLNVKINQFGKEMHGCFLFCHHVKGLGGG